MLKLRSTAKLVVIGLTLILQLSTSSCDPGDVIIVGCKAQNRIC